MLRPPTCHSASSLRATHPLISDSFGAEDSSENTLAAHDATKTLEVQANRVLREQKLKLGKMKKDNANLRALLESESTSKAEPLPGMSVMVPRTKMLLSFCFKRARLIRLWRMLLGWHRRRKRTPAPPHPQQALLLLHTLTRALLTLAVTATLAGWSQKSGGWRSSWLTWQGLMHAWTKSKKNPTGWRLKFARRSRCTSTPARCRPLHP